MATVHLARDLKHRRLVAIKLFHPGEAAGVLYYVMPFVSGESLRARLRAQGALPVDETLRIAVTWWARSRMRTRRASCPATSSPRT